MNIKMLYVIDNKGVHLYCTHMYTDLIGKVNFIVDYSVLLWIAPENDTPKRL